MTPWQNASDRVRVMVVEHQEDLRADVQCILEASGGIVCTCYCDAESAMLALKFESPQVVILDIRLPGMDGIAYTRFLRKHHPQVHVLICTANAEDECLFEALRAGARGYLLKDSTTDELVGAIWQVLAGGAPMAPRIARRVVESFCPLLHPHDTLSEREAQVLDLLVKGLSAKEVGERLFVSTNTIRTHIRHIYEKMNVQSRVEMLNQLKKGR